jgi:hypothetical protein
MFKVAADKLLDLVELRAEEIAKEWWKNVRQNPRTPSYHPLLEREAVAQAVLFYKNLRRIYYSENPYEEGVPYFSQYAKERHAEGIPLHEAIYAMVLMRRHMWLFAEYQDLFTNLLDMYGAIQVINRTVLITDYATFITAQKYHEMTA